MPKTKPKTFKPGTFIYHGGMVFEIDNSGKKRPRKDQEVMPSRPEVQRVRMRLHNATRRACGICTSCGDPAPNGVLCDRHLEARRLREHSIRANSKFIPVRT